MNGWCGCGRGLGGTLILMPGVPIRSRVRQGQRLHNYNLKPLRCQPRKLTGRARPPMGLLALQSPVTSELCRATGLRAASGGLLIAIRQRLEKNVG